MPNQKVKHQRKLWRLRQHRYYAKPEKRLLCIERWNRRRAAKAGVDLEVVDLQKVWERDGKICQICFCGVVLGEFSADHKIPIVAGGGHTFENVQTAHVRCNNYVKNQKNDFLVDSRNGEPVR